MLTRTWNNSHKLLVGMQNGTATLEKTIWKQKHMSIQKSVHKCSQNFIKLLNLQFPKTGNYANTHQVEYYSATKK